MGTTGDKQSRGKGAPTKSRRIGLRSHRAGSAKAKRYARSAITNGTKLINGVDGTSAEYRRWRDLYLDAMQRSGGAEQLARSYATLCVERERLDAAAARGEPVDPWEVVRLANTIARLDSRFRTLCGESQVDAARLERERREDAEAGLI